MNKEHKEERTRLGTKSSSTETIYPSCPSFSFLKDAYTFYCNYRVTQMWLEKKTENKKNEGIIELIKKVAKMINGRQQAADKICLMHATLESTNSSHIIQSKC